MRTRIQLQRAALAIVLLASAVRVSADQPSAQRFHNVRTRDVPVGLALTGCYDGSLTCRHLIETIESSTTIVIVGLGYCKTATGVPASCLNFMANSGEFRYLRLTIDPALRGDTLVSMLAHELQHAVEIVQAPRVTDTESLRGLYQRIGYRINRYVSDNVWETEEARRTTNVVADELKQTRKSLLLARREPLR